MVACIPAVKTSAVGRRGHVWMRPECRQDEGVSVILVIAFASITDRLVTGILTAITIKQRHHE